MSLGPDLLNRSRNSIALIAVMIALALIVLAGLLLLLGAGIGVFVFSAAAGPPGVKEGISATALLVPVMVLLVAILILLLILLWCCCLRGGKGLSPELLRRLLGLFPLVSRLPEAFRAIAAALRRAAAALGFIQDSLKGAGAAFKAAHDAQDWFSVEVKNFKLKNMLPGWNYVDDPPGRTISLDTVKRQIGAGSTSLLSYVTEDANGQTEIDKILRDLNNAADVLDEIANALTV